MINKRTLSFAGSILTIILFATGITVMATGLVELPSVPSNTTQEQISTAAESTVVPTETAIATIVSTDTTSSVTVLDTTGQASTSQPTVDVIAQSTAIKPGGDDVYDGDGLIVDPSVQLLSKANAIAIAQAQVGGSATVIEIALERDDNPPLYAVKLIAGGYKYEIKIHALTGAVIDLEKDVFESEEDGEED